MYSCLLYTFSKMLSEIQTYVAKFSTPGMMDQMSADALQERWLLPLTLLTVGRWGWWPIRICSQSMTECVPGPDFNKHSALPLPTANDASIIDYLSCIVSVLPWSLESKHWCYYKIPISKLHIFWGKIKIVLKVGIKNFLNSSPLEWIYMMKNKCKKILLWWFIRYCLKWKHNSY